MIAERKQKVEQVNEEIYKLLNKRDPKGLELLFDYWYKPLVVWSNTFINDLNLAEDIVQDFFIDIWDKKIYKQFNAKTLSSYLRVSIKNRCLNKINKTDVLSNFVGLEKIEQVWENYDYNHDQIYNYVIQEISTLSERTQEILKHVFVQGMKYHEVANKLDISLSTVKTSVNRAIIKIREKVNQQEFIELLFILINDSNN